MPAVRPPAVIGLIFTLIALPIVLVIVPTLCPRRAGAAVPLLRIECPLLDNESRAALEARARAEMALTPLPAGEIAIACEVHSARVGWRAANGGLRQREVALGPDATAAVDSLLGAVHALRFDNSSTGTGSATPIAGAIAAPAPPAAGARTPTRPLQLRVGVVAGLYSELWDGAIGGAVEAQLGLRLSWRERWSLLVAGGLGRGVESAEGIRARTLRAMASVGYLAGAHLELRLGGEWRALTADLAGEAPSTPRATTGGGFVAARYLLSRGRFRFGVGPQLGLDVAPIAVQIAAREVFRIPRFLAGLSVVGEGDFIR